MTPCPALTDYGYDESSAMPALTYVRLNKPIPNAQRGVIRCARCAHVRHGECDRRSGGQCSCLQCWGDETKKALSARLRERWDPLLADALYQLMQAGDRSLRAARNEPGPVRYGTCLCGCGIEVWGSRMGPHRKYATASCRQRAYRRRKREKAKAAPGLGAAIRCDG